MPLTNARVFRGPLPRCHPSWPVCASRTTCRYHSHRRRCSVAVPVSVSSGFATAFPVVISMRTGPNGFWGPVCSPSPVSYYRWPESEFENLATGVSKEGPVGPGQLCGSEASGPAGKMSLLFGGGQKIPFGRMWRGRREALGGKDTNKCENEIWTKKCNLKQ